MGAEAVVADESSPVVEAEAVILGLEWRDRWDAFGVVAFFGLLSVTLLVISPDWPNRGTGIFGLVIIPVILFVELRKQVRIDAGGIEMRRFRRTRWPWATITCAAPYFRKQRAGSTSGIADAFLMLRDDGANVKCRQAVDASRFTAAVETFAPQTLPRSLHANAAVVESVASPAEVRQTLEEVRSILGSPRRRRPALVISCVLWWTGLFWGVVLLRYGLTGRLDAGATLSIGLGLVPLVVIAALTTLASFRRAPTVAITDDGLRTLDRSGAVVMEIAYQDIAGIEAISGGESTPDIVVLTEDAAWPLERNGVVVSYGSSEERYTTQLATALQSWVAASPDSRRAALASDLRSTGAGRTSPEASAANLMLLGGAALFVVAIIWISTEWDAASFVLARSVPTIGIAATEGGTDGVEMVDIDYDVHDVPMTARVSISADVVHVGDAVPIRYDPFAPAEPWTAKNDPWPRDTMQWAVAAGVLGAVGVGLMAGAVGKRSAADRSSPQ